MKPFKNKASDLDKRLTDLGIVKDIRRGLMMSIIILFTTVVAYASSAIGEILPVFIVWAIPVSWAIVHKFFTHLSWLDKLNLTIGIMFDSDYYRNKYSLAQELRK